jgi:serine protease AprX
MKMAPDADLVGIRVMNAEGSGRPSDIVKGVQWAIQNKEKYNISVINMSLGGAPDGVPYYLDPINKAVEKAVENGISVVAAAGNSGPEPSTIGSPADDPKAFSIGAALNPTTVSDFSSRGPTDDNFSKPDIIAPGEFITSWAVPNSQLDKIATTVETIRRMSPEQLRKLFTAKPELIKALGLPKDLLKKDDAQMELITKTTLPPMHKPTADTLAGPGTSFASPEVAGIVANLRQAHPSATPDQVKDALMATADNMGSQYTKLDQGAGFVRADEAHQELSKG